MNKIISFLKGLWKFIATAGFTKIIYLILFLFFLSIGSKILAGASLGIFFYINFNVLQKMYKNWLNKE